MPLESSKAIVLGSLLFNEKDKLVHLLSAHDGIIKVVVPGSSGGKNRFGSLLELFTEGEFFFYRKENRDLATLSKGEVFTSFFETVSEPGRVFYFYLIAEIILKFVPPNFDSGRIYKLVLSILKDSASDTDMGILLLYFMIWILRIEGMMFEPGICLKCKATVNSDAWITEDYRGVVCINCRTEEKISIEKSAIDFIEWSKRNSAGEIKKTRFKNFSKQIYVALKEKIEYHGEFNLNSSRYLKEFR